jgi:erythromycin esterase-like protein
MAGLVIAMACGSAHAVPVPPPEDTAVQLMRHAGNARLVVLGEYHGTTETPRLVAGLVERYSRDNAAVRLALELPMSENVALARYLRSDGDADAREALRTSPFWIVKDDQHDGRRSRDMLDLIDAVRALRAQGRDVGIAGYDVETGTSTDNQTRDTAMATHLRQQFSALPTDARMLVLTGNAHALRARPQGAPAEMQQQPMAAQLRDLPLYSVRLDALRGEAWACLDRCGPRSLVEQPARAPRVDTHPQRSYDLVVWMPQLSVGRLVD